MKTLRADQTAAIDNVREAIHESALNGESLEARLLTEKEDQVISDLRAALQKTRRVVLQSPTGWGKTVVAADIVARAQERRKKVLITVPAVSLIDQTVEALWSQGIRGVGVIQANHEMTDWSQPVQVASVQTLIKRAEKPEAHVVIVDECHKWFRYFGTWFASEAWRKVPFIGLSATPWLKGLGSYFDKLVVGNTIAQMIEEKTLAPFRVFAASHPDLEGVRSVRSTNGEIDYVETDLAERMNRPKLTADIVQSWKQLAEDRPTICFAVNRDHAAQLAKEFESAGVPSGYMDCETPRQERGELRRRFQNGDIRVMCNVDVIGLGVDWPEVSCISYCRPTRSEMRYVQNIGRGLRIAKGKDDLIVIDHSDTTMRLGFVSDIFHEELDDGKPKINGAAPMELPKECPKCHYLKRPRMAKCPACGFVVEHHATPIKVQTGALREVKPEDLNKPKPIAAKLGVTLEDKARVYGQLMWHQKKHNKRDGFANANYKEIYGVWPRVGETWKAYFTAPDMTLASWLKHKAIAWAKRNGGPRWTGQNGKDKSNGALTDREQEAFDRVREVFVDNGLRPADGSLMSEKDWEDFR
jgi:DNA repair protein RadD